MFNWDDWYLKTVAVHQGFKNFTGFFLYIVCGSISHQFVWNFSFLLEELLLKKVKLISKAVYGAHLWVALNFAHHHYSSRVMGWVGVPGFLTLGWGRRSWWIPARVGAALSSQPELSCPWPELRPGNSSSWLQKVHFPAPFLFTPTGSLPLCRIVHQFTLQVLSLWWYH